VKLLKSLGCDTRTCDDGQECVDLLESLGKAEITHDSRFDLILMDLEMRVFFVDLFVLLAHFR
jgi:CheY-like chemotaxis protein